MTRTKSHYLFLISILAIILFVTVATVWTAPYIIVSLNQAAEHPYISLPLVFAVCTALILYARYDTKRTRQRQVAQGHILPDGSLVYTTPDGQRWILACDAFAQYPEGNRQLKPISDKP